MTMMSFKSSLSKTSRKITWSVVCSPPWLSHFRQSTLFLRNSWSHCDHKVFTAQLWGDTSSHNGFSLSAPFQRKIILRSEFASCYSLKKVEVQVGSNLAVVQGSPTGASQLIVLNRAMHHSLNTHIRKRHWFLWIPSPTPLATDITESTGKCIRSRNQHGLFSLFRQLFKEGRFWTITNILDHYIWTPRFKQSQQTY